MRSITVVQIGRLDYDHFGGLRFEIFRVPFSTTAWAELKPLKIQVIGREAT
jgi:hypothetical protein